MTKTLIFIFLGGGLGSVLRFSVQQMLHQRIIPYSFPWATFTVNILGSFLIGLFYAWSARFNLATEYRVLLTTGLCGGFTTFSTFSNDGVILLKSRIIRIILHLFYIKYHVRSSSSYSWRSYRRKIRIQ